MVNKQTNNNFLYIFIAITSIIVILDQLTKILIKQTKPTLQFLFLNIHYSTNTGAGFGIFQNSSFLLGILSLIFVIALILYYPKIPKTKIYQIVSALLLGGAIGNMIDRLIRREVIDFIATSFWPSFNVADAAISISAIIIIILLIKEETMPDSKIDIKKTKTKK
ncbi:signal peptidase II [archaeon]|jgi:signal peptidase II|nr:signal peptidase II [archaeon]MBT6697764.1 signal peptidase II [archaeon]